MTLLVRSGTTKRLLVLCSSCCKFEPGRIRSGKEGASIGAGFFPRTPLRPVLSSKCDVEIAAYHGNHLPGSFGDFNDSSSNSRVPEGVQSFEGIVR